MILELHVNLLWHRVLRVIVRESWHKASWMLHDSWKQHALRHAQATVKHCFASGKVIFVA